MPPVALNVFLNSRCPGWQSRSVDVVNSRLQHLGRYNISFTNRNRGPVTGTIQLVDVSPYDSVFWFGCEKRWQTVVDYFLIRYGAFVKIVNDEDDEVESVYSLTPVFTDLQSALICFAVAYSIVVVLGLLMRDVEWESDTCDFKLKKFDQNVRTLLEDQESSAKIVKDTLLRRANSLPNLNVIRVDVGSIQSVCEAGRAEGTAEMPARSKL
ncbi:hypothetical protein B9Z55_028884 [Caenorhabditis nigoni]|uniref:Uncharacterized protein n=1 Tax=Caenorhabditis nigoni TaxID=1611254 RepID=A0A2G5SA03_9PELO|nr:hypothetical protein B9Z55_028884 [Caenorhabditis nigoni]